MSRVRSPLHHLLTTESEREKKKKKRARFQQVDADNVRANIPADTETVFNDQTANRRQPSVRGWTCWPGEDAET